MNLQPFKKAQTVTDLANVYTKTVQAFIINFFDFAMNNTKITSPEILQHFKLLVIFALYNGSEDSITNHSVIGSNDVFAMLPFMQDHIKPSESLTTDNFYKENRTELVKALNEGVDTILSERIESSDNFTDKEKALMKTTLKEYVVSEDLL